MKLHINGRKAGFKSRLLKEMQKRGCFGSEIAAKPNNLKPVNGTKAKKVIKHAH